MTKMFMSNFTKKSSRTCTVLHPSGTSLRAPDYADIMSPPGYINPLNWTSSSLAVHVVAQHPVLLRQQLADLQLPRQRRPHQHVPAKFLENFRMTSSCSIKLFR